MNAADQLIVVFRYDWVFCQHRSRITIENGIDEEVQSAAVAPGDNKLNRFPRPISADIRPQARLAKNLPQFGEA